MATTKRDREAIDKAEQLISEGKIRNSNSWSPPSAEAENRFIEENGFEAFGSWHFGRDETKSRDTKERYTFIYTSDWENVDIQGLRAVAQRAAQTDMEQLSNIASNLLDRAQEKVS